MPYDLYEDHEYGFYPAEGNGEIPPEEWKTYDNIVLFGDPRGDMLLKKIDDPKDMPGYIAGLYNDPRNDPEMALHVQAYINKKEVNFTISVEMGENKN